MLIAARDIPCACFSRQNCCDASPMISINRLLNSVGVHDRAPKLCTSLSNLSVCVMCSNAMFVVLLVNDALALAVALALVIVVPSAISYMFRAVRLDRYQRKRSRY